jgi:hypothetical protein
MKKCIALVLACGIGWAGGCAPPAPRPDVAHPDPSVRIPGMVTAVRREQEQSLPQLIESLDSPDPAVRLFAIQALQRLTGQRLGYEYFHDEAERQPAVQRWRRWLEQQQRPE